MQSTGAMKLARPSIGAALQGFRLGLLAQPALVRRSFSLWWCKEIKAEWSLKEHL